MQHYEIERLAQRVRASARDDGLIETAQVKLVGLDDVRRAAGGRWPRMREHVREGSIRIIAQRIGPDDAVIPCGDGFLVIFADASAEHTQARCSEIRDALVAFYLGEEALRELSAHVRRETVAVAHLAGLVSKEGSQARVADPHNEVGLGRFWPVWSPQRMAIAAHLCGPLLRTSTTARLGYSYDFLEKGSHREGGYLDLDLCLLEQARAAAEQPSSSAIGVCVHSTTMQSRKTRTLYLDHLAAGATNVHHRMFVTIAEVEPGTPLISLTEWTSALKRHFPRVALELHHTDRALSAIGVVGAWAAGFHLAATKPKSSAQVRQALNQLDRWCRTLRGQGLMPFVGGFQDATFLDIAGYSDLAFATGELLWPSVAAPPGVQLPARGRAQLSGEAAK